MRREHVRSNRVRADLFSVIVLSWQDLKTEIVPRVICLIIGLGSMSMVVMTVMKLKMDDRKRERSGISHISSA